MDDELLREIDLDGRRYQIRRTDHQIETWWRVGSTHRGTHVWLPAFGLYVPGGSAIGHTVELDRHLAEIRADQLAEAKRRLREPL